MRNRGWTLSQMIIAISIIALVMGLSIPVISRTIQTAREVKTQAELSSLYKVITMYFGYTGRFPKTLADLKDYIIISNIEKKFELNPNLPLRGAK